jgi:hypothetical protein
LRACIIGLEAKCGIENASERAVVNLHGLGVSVGGARQDPVFKDLTTLVRSIDDGEHGVEHLAVAFCAALEHAILADTAGAKV